MEPTSFPLVWPQGWPRSPFKQGSRFKTPSITDGVSKIESELKKLDAKNLIISTNLKPTLGRTPEMKAGADLGAAVYFRFKDTPIALACDKWSRVADNIWAIACHIENLRSQERWGVGKLEQAFSGYKALAEKSGGALAWWQVFGYAALADVRAPAVREKYRTLAAILHPDKGGDKDKMIELNMAYADAAKFFKENGVTI